MSEEIREKARKLIGQLWEKHKDSITERVADLERRVAEARNSEWSEASRLEARNDAHKLAGSLGTFGHQSATEAARQAELILDQPSVSADQTETLVQLVQQIRLAVDSPPS
jgi:HPt (histidine-containing phosphotransfer) domain-containing protein